MRLPTLLPAILCLTACMPQATKPSPAPVVHCEQPATPDVADWPEDWQRDGPPWAVGVLGILEEERRLRGIEHDCLVELRARGVIR